MLLLAQPPSPLSVDVICTSPLGRLPNAFASECQEARLKYPSAVSIHMPTCVLSPQRLPPHFLSPPCPCLGANFLFLPAPRPLLLLIPTPQFCPRFTHQKNGSGRKKNGNLRNRNSFCHEIVSISFSKKLFDKSLIVSWTIFLQWIRHEIDTRDLCLV